MSSNHQALQPLKGEQEVQEASLKLFLLNHLYYSNFPSIELYTKLILSCLGDSFGQIFLLQRIYEKVRFVQMHYCFNETKPGK